ncbi:MAG: endonuclease domain-containing protein [Bacteroidota bacterium]
MENSDSMFYGAHPSVFEKAKKLRSNMTKHEKLLWDELRANKLNGLRFKAEHPIHTFIADFYCHKLRLVIEVDGTSHNNEDQIEYDKGRTYSMKQYGIKVLRFTNNEIEKDITKVINYIKVKCQGLIGEINSTNNE